MSRMDCSFLALQGSPAAQAQTATTGHSGGLFPPVENAPLGCDTPRKNIAIIAPGITAGDPSRLYTPSSKLLSTFPMFELAAYTSGLQSSSPPRNTFAPSYYQYTCYAACGVRKCHVSRRSQTGLKTPSLISKPVSRKLFDFDNTRPALGSFRMATRPQSRFLPEPNTVAIVCCPFRGGQTKLGVDKAPDYFIEAGLPQQLADLGWDVKFDGRLQFEEIDVQNDTPIGKLKNPRLVSSACKAVAQAVGEHAKQGMLPVTLGGDHSLAMATISRTLKKHPDTCLIYVDAHTDINTAETTESGNMHGMPVSFVLGIGPKVDEFAWLQPCLKPHRLVYIGVRDVDESERRILREHGIKAFSMHDVDKHGIGRVVEMALDHVNPGRMLPVHMSFDIDAFDPSVAPATVLPVRRGLTYGQGLYICEAVHETGCLVALDIVEVNPLVGDEQGVKQTVAAGCAVARAALGQILL